MFLKLFVVLIGLAAGVGVRGQGVGGSADVEAFRPGRFAILPWDQMQLIDGPEDKVHGLASLAACNFTFAGFPRVADLAACEKLGLKAIVYPEDSLGLTKPQHLSDEQLEKAVRTLAEQTKIARHASGTTFVTNRARRNSPIWARS